MQQEWHVLTAFIRHRTSDSAIIIYSTASHRVVKRLSVSQAGQVVDFQVNERFLVAVSTVAEHFCPFSSLILARYCRLPSSHLRSTFGACQPSKPHLSRRCSTLRHIHTNSPRCTVCRRLAYWLMYQLPLQRLAEVVS